MNTIMMSVDRNQVLESFRADQEPEWVTVLREQGFRLAEELPLPKLEKTNIERWNLGTFGEIRRPAQRDSLKDAGGATSEWIDSDNALVQRNSGIEFHRLTEELRGQGVIFTGLEQAVRENPELVKPYLMQAVRADENRMTAIHAALWSGGAFLYVPKNVQVAQPLQALFLLDDEEACFMPHVLIVAEENSSVTFVESAVSAVSRKHDQFGITEVFVKRGAEVHVASVRGLGKQVTDMTYRRAHVEAAGRIRWVVGEMNAGNAMADTASILQGDGAESDAKVICVGAGEQHMNLTTRAVHIGQFSTSDMVTRAVMREDATAIINGITKIEKGASGTNGQQTEKVLMLSPKARGDANPILLIDEDDVQAGHAASVGQVNPEQIFYLMSRGIAQAEAERLIVYGFLAPVISEIPNDRLRDRLQSLAERKLGQA
ncbi:Fe-S cluster assembly protein SufD [Paenibacillus favisporus]|uniref:Fe-S cluster assembly protein SufD n=1 Tax=Paenibacillus favisporus TaxID=221028 RepID=A0ABV2F046_9BACL